MTCQGLFLRQRRTAALFWSFWAGSGMAVGLESTAHAQDPDSGEDLTETIPSGSDSAGGDVREDVTTGDLSAEGGVPTDLAAPADPSSSETRMQVSGYARQSFELVYGELSRKSGNVAAPVLWRDVFISRTQLALRASYLKGRHFEATISGVLGYTLHVAEEPPQYSLGIVPLTRGDVDPQLREAYLGFFWPAVDLRIGQQRVAWGRADFTSPNDVINARDLRDPFLGETELRYLPTPVIRASVSGGAVTFEAVVSPFFVPDRFDVYGANWAALQPRSPDNFQAFVGNASTVVDSSVERDFAPLWRQTERPEDNGKGISAGAHLSANLSGTDLGAYYHYGYDSLPFLSATQEFIEYLDSTDFASRQASNLAPLLDLLDADIQPYRAHYIRRHHVGFDLATAIGSVTLRLDVGYDTQRVFYTTNLLSFSSPAVLGVAAFEYQTGSLDDVFIIELLGAHLADKPTDPLLVYEQDSAAVAG
ncbi:MAG TPA: DUF1302 family protein, partial [Polyangiaceae bacterium]|nr:DUF1302 family protein [Polyangiaceae bacterium]